MARYLYRHDREESIRLQSEAHKGNHLLLKPVSGIIFKKLTLISKNRIEGIIEWIKQFDTYSQLDIALSDILEKLTFGVKADKFEEALNVLSSAMGYAGERPDKEWKEGPDNLWALDDNNYLLFECKNEVELTRVEINKHETEQMNRSSAWFEKHYPGLKVKRIMIHPTNIVASAASFTDEVQIMRVKELNKFKNSIREFYKSFKILNLQDLSIPHIQKHIMIHGLNIDDITTKYSVKTKNKV